jgi:hypothetical protein
LPARTGLAKAPVTAALLHTEALRDVFYINADDIASEQFGHVTDDVERNTRAAEVAEILRRDALDQGQAFAFETLGSTVGKLAFIDEPIAAVLQEELPVTGKVLEVASGSGEHCAFFAELFPGHIWQPTDPDPDALGSIESWCAGLDNVLPPLALDAASADWPVHAADAVLCINMAHISPWEATLGLVAGAERLLAKGAALMLYGPWRRDGVETAPSNEAFDASLKSRDPRWGLRRVGDFDAAARAFARTRLVEMPANHLMMIYRR